MIFFALLGLHLPLVLKPSQVFECETKETSFRKALQQALHECVYLCAFLRVFVFRLAKSNGRLVAISTWFWVILCPGDLMQLLSFMRSIWYTVGSLCLVLSMDGSKNTFVVVPSLNKRTVNKLIPIPLNLSNPSKRFSMAVEGGVLLFSKFLNWCIGMPAMGSRRCWKCMALSAFVTWALVISVGVVF